MTILFNDVGLTHSTLDNIVQLNRTILIQIWTVQFNSIALYRLHTWQDFLTKLNHTDDGSV